MVFLGFKTIRVGDRYLIQNHLGDVRIVDGPARLTLFRSTAEQLRLHFAADDQYLDIQQKDGKRIVQAGPCSM